MPKRQRLEVKFVSTRQNSTKSTTPLVPHWLTLSSVSFTTASP